MRLCEKDKKEHWLRRAVKTGQKDAYQQDIITWGEATPIRANRQPITDAVSAQLYGAEMKRMYRLYYDGQEVLRAGDRLCIHVPPDQPPDYKLTDAPSYNGHQVLTVEWVPPDQRAPAAKDVSG